MLFDRILQAGLDGFAKAIRDVEGPYAFVYYEVALLCNRSAADHDARQPLDESFTGVIP